MELCNRSPEVNSSAVMVVVKGDGGGEGEREGKKRRLEMAAQWGKIFLFLCSMRGGGCLWLPALLVCVCVRSCMLGH